METATQEKAEIIRGETIIKVPYNNSTVKFVYPGEEPNNYTKVSQSILEKGLRLATGGETASLIYESYCSPEISESLEAKAIKEIMRSRWIWVANRNLWTPEGVYVADDEKGVGRTQAFDINELEQKLVGSKEIKGVKFSKDGKLRFAPRNTYQSGEQSPEDFEKNGFIIASYGIEGAEKLAEVSKKFSYKPRVWTVETSDNPELRLSALCGYGGSRLDASGGSLDGYRDALAFGVRA